MTAIRPLAPRRRVFVRFGVFLVLVLSGGCGPRTVLPPMYQATGSVVYAGAGPVAGGTIQFTSLGDTSFTVAGDIQDDGTFRLHTIKGNHKVSGAPEGEYRVTVQPPIPKDHRPVPAIVLPKFYRIEPRDNQFSIEVPAPANST